MQTPRRNRKAILLSRPGRSHCRCCTLEAPRPPSDPAHRAPGPLSSIGAFPLLYPRGSSSAIRPRSGPISSISASGVARLIGVLRTH